MNEINYTQGMWADLDYRRQMTLYTEAMSQSLTISGRQFLEMVGCEPNNIIIIRRPDKLSPKKEVMKHTMD